MTTLKNAVLLADSEQERGEINNLAMHRIDWVQSLELDSSDIVERLFALKTEALGQPCKPFVPGIQEDAAVTIQSIRNNEKAALSEELLDLVCRLMGFYMIGPKINGLNPEFGFRLMPTNPLNLEAAACICHLVPEIAEKIGIEKKPDQLPQPI